MTVQLGRDSDYMTRERRAVRIVAVDGNRVVNGVRYPVIALNEVGVPNTFTEDGRLIGGTEHGCDIIERPRKFRREMWVNVYPADYYWYHSREDADRFCDPSRIACVKVIVEGVAGDGLEEKK